MNSSQKYLIGVIVAFLPALSGCLNHFAIKADVEADGGISEASENEVNEDAGEEATR